MLYNAVIKKLYTCALYTESPEMRDESNYNFQAFPIFRTFLHGSVHPVKGDIIINGTWMALVLKVALFMSMHLPLMNKGESSL